MDQRSAVSFFVVMPIMMESETLVSRQSSIGSGTGFERVEELNLPWGAGIVLLLRHFHRLECTCLAVHPVVQKNALNSMKYLGAFQRAVFRRRRHRVHVREAGVGLVDRRDSGTCLAFSAGRILSVGGFWLLFETLCVVVMYGLAARVLHATGSRQRTNDEAHTSFPVSVHD
jgi:hypothetical protein